MKPRGLEYALAVGLYLTGCGSETPLSPEVASMEAQGQAFTRELGDLGDAPEPAGSGVEPIRDKGDIAHGYLIGVGGAERAILSLMATLHKEDPSFDEFRRETIEALREYCDEYREGKGGMKGFEPEQAKNIEVLCDDLAEHTRARVYDSVSGEEIVKTYRGDQDLDEEVGAVYRATLNIGGEYAEALLEEREALRSELDRLIEQGEGTPESFQDGVDGLRRSEEGGAIDWELIRRANAMGLY